MARLVLQDYLQAYPFHLMDIAPVAGVPLFTPLSCFSSITAPTITIETKTINEGNNPYKTTVVKGASVGSMTLARGVSATNSDFYRWVQTAIQGSTSLSLTKDFLPFSTNQVNGGPTYRRNMLLIHFFARSPVGVFGNNTANQVSTGVVGTAALAGVGLSLDAITGAGVGDTALLGAGQAADQVWGYTGLSSGVVRVPARVFLLKDCVPIRYKSGSDFDASSSEVSIQELEIQPQSWTEISLLTPAGI